MDALVPSTKQHHERGYALLLTLVLLTMVGSMLAITARASSRHALEAIDAGERLQRKWALRSCEELLLPQARHVLDETSTLPSTKGHPPHLASRTLQLADLQIELVFASEDAKLNVNALLDWHSTRDAKAILTQLAPGSFFFPKFQETPESLERPQSSKTSSKQAPLVSVWDDFLHDADPDRLFRGRGQGWGTSQAITCWSEGPVDFRHAPREVLEAALKPDLGMSQLGKLLRLRAEEPDITLGTALSRLELTHQQRERVAKRLTDRSATYSLWTVMRDRHRSWYAFTVAGDHATNETVIKLRW